MTPEQERWAEALAIEKWKGAGAPVYVAERIGALALAGDERGIERFMEIARLLDQVRGGRRRPDITSGNEADLDLRQLTMPIMGADYPNKRGPGRRFEIRLCAPGEPVELSPEPKNKVDPRAIAIYSERGVQLGYVPGEKCQLLTSMLMRGTELTAIFQEETPRGGLIRVGVGCVPKLPPPRQEPVLEDWPPRDQEWDD